MISVYLHVANKAFLKESAGPVVGTAASFLGDSGFEPRFTYHWLMFLVYFSVFGTIP